MGYSTRQITGQLNRHYSTIAHEVKRNTQKTYAAELADELSRQRHSACHHPERNPKKLFKSSNII